MRMLKIACGRSRNALNWSNRTISWEDLCERLRTTFRTKETVAQYKAMTRAERDDAKDKGGFVGGHLRNGRRRVKDVECRSLLSLDADHAEPGFIDRFEHFCDAARSVGQLDTDDIRGLIGPFIGLEELFSFIRLVDDDAQDAEITGIRKAQRAQVDVCIGKQAGELCELSGLIFHKNRDLLDRIHENPPF